MFMHYNYNHNDISMYMYSMYIVHLMILWRTVTGYKHSIACIFYTSSLHVHAIISYRFFPRLFAIACLVQYRVCAGAVYYTQLLGTPVSLEHHVVLYTPDRDKHNNNTLHVHVCTIFIMYM